MTVDEISMLAYKNDMPDIHALTVPEWLLWYRLRDVYRQNRDSPEDGVKQKAVALRQYELDRSDWVSAKEVYEHMAKFWKDIEESAKAFTTNQNAETARKFFEAVYKVPVKDQITYWEKEGETE